MTRNRMNLIRLPILVMNATLMIYDDYIPLSFIYHLLKLSILFNFIY